MAKLLVLANDWTTIYNFRREIVRALVEAGHEVILNYPLGEHTEEIKALGCKVIDADVSRRGTSIAGDLKYYKACKKLIRETKPDVVLTYTVKPNVYGSLAAQKTKTPYVNNVTGISSALENGGLLAKLVLTLQKKGLKKSRCVFFQNPENRRLYIEKKVIRPDAHTVLLPGSGVNLELHKFEEYPEETDALKFLIISRVREDKGFNEFFDMAERIKKEVPKAEFHIAGWYEEDSYAQRVKELEKKGIVVYHGKKNPEEVHELIRQSHCIIHPSYHEGMANVILEAAASGRPVLASNIHGCVEGFDEGSTGFAFEVKNADALYACVKKFIALPYSQKAEMGRKARKKMEKEFDRQFVAQAYLKEIKNITEA